jgi:asparagine synthase (glutamine-hydrolysing)
MTGYIPDRVINRRDKIGFDVPDDKWLLDPKMIEFTRGLIESRSFKERKYWDQKRVKKEFEQYVSGIKRKAVTAHDVWKWINLELWFRYFIDRKIE